MALSKIKAYRQLDGRDCGPTCVRIIAKYYGEKISLSKLVTLSETTREGSSIQNISIAAQKIGFKTMGIRISYDKLKQGVPLPCIIFWQQRHFVVVYKIKKDKIWIADPAHGKLKITKDELIKNWIGNNATVSTKAGVALLLNPTENLKTNQSDIKESKNKFKFILKYAFEYKKMLFQLFLALVVGTLLQFIFPFLTQSIVDIGIQNHDIDFIYLILIAQLFLFLGQMFIDILKGWILLQLSTKINISLISDFFIKLMNLPISFFDSKMTGDIMLRIRDHKRIEKLLTTTSLNALFSVFTLIVFGFILAWYNIQIFRMFFIGSVLYFIWIILFLRKRRDIDYKRFTQQSSEQDKMMELINGMQEIKLHNAERKKRWSWEYLRAQLFKIEMKNLALQQTQAIGAKSINELKNILIIIISAKLVIDGVITLGMMISISYIIGQLNSPVKQLIGFIYGIQDAKIALERLAQIHNQLDEIELDKNKKETIPLNQKISIKKISFKYKGALNKVINDLSITIMPNKTTAIVGASGSGKTTLLKLLLKYYEVDSGIISVGNINLNELRQKKWREQCGVVMQDGYIFNDSIANNITIGQKSINKKLLHKAAKIANILEYVDKLPNRFETKIGLEGLSLSTGQKQRVLIARAVYKNPKFIFFDEATSALDAKNEKIIVSNLNIFFKNRTAVIIAHRLSTVVNADQIIVLDKGRILESGTHQELIQLKNYYYSLVKNQLNNN